MQKVNHHGLVHYKLESLTDLEIRRGRGQPPITFGFDQSSCPAALHFRGES